MINSFSLYRLQVSVARENFLFSSMSVYLILNIPNYSVEHCAKILIQRTALADVPSWYSVVQCFKNPETKPNKTILAQCGA